MSHEAPSEAPFPPCKRVLSVLLPQPRWQPGLCAAAESVFGQIDYRSPFVPFEAGYYDAEFGKPLYRGWLSFRGLADPAGLAAWKHATAALEAQATRDGRRPFNLDPGYLDPDKLVLASCKPGPRKLYIGEGVWADMISGYSGGVFTPVPWTFPDFRAGRYDKILGVIRQKLKAEMRR